MRKTILTASLLVILTLSLTELATSQGTANWKDNLFTNQTSGAVFVAFTTYRPATSEVPLGWRTVAWYHIKAGQSHTFRAYQENPIYYLIIDQATGRRLLPEDAKSYTGWMYNKAFVIVSRNEPNTLTPAGNLLFTTHARTSNLLLRDSNFFKSENTGSVTVTPTGVIAPLAELIGDDRGDDDDGTVDLEVEDATGIAINITPDPSSTTLNQGDTRKLTVSVKKDGSPLSNRDIFLSVSDKAMVNPASGKTDDAGQFSTTLTVSKSSPEGAFNVTANLIGTTDKKILSFTVKVDVGQLRISASPSTIEPGRTSTLTITSLTHGGTPFPGVQISLAGGNINPTLVTTDANGQARATFRADQYSGTRRPKTISRSTVTATVVNNPSVKGTATLTVAYVLGSFSVSGFAGVVLSGSSTKLTTTVKSRSGIPMPGVRVTIVEGNDSEIWFSSLSGTTNSSGQWSTTQYAAYSGPADFSVKVSGLPTQVFRLTVKPQTGTSIETWTHRAGCKGGGWLHRSAKFDFSGGVTTGRTVVTVVSYSIRETGSSSGGSRDWRITGHSKSGSIVTLAFDLWQNNCRGGKSESWVKFWVDGTLSETYPRWTGGYGAPSLDPQAYEQDLSLVAAHPQMRLPAETALLANYPNPFNPETWIPYHLSDPAEVTLSIYSAEGRLVRTLALGHQDAGIYESKSRAAYWDGKNSVGERVASGLYFYTLTAGDFAATNKMLIMK